MASDGAGAAAAGAALAAQGRLEEEEEEELTHYSPNDLNQDWEFKILRGSFRDPARMRAILEEEKRGGWILVEKFDDARIRLKRRPRVKAIEEDFASGYDPYRTYAGPSAQVVLLVSGLLLALAMMIVLIVDVSH
jgi:hypothetical protein